MNNKREVTFEDSTYKVRSNKIVIPNFAQMNRFEALQWLCRHTYARGYSRANPLQGIGSAISFTSIN